MNLTQACAATLPAGFVEESVGGTWNEAVGLTFDSSSRLYVWERGGRVWIVENGVRLSQPLIDISDEVGGWRDYGMLGFALHPNFAQNGYLYLLYVVDHHHVKYYGAPDYDPAANEYYQATIGRLTRYTARASDGFRTVEPNSRKVLVGETAGAGFPIMHQSHGTGTLLFGRDGTLLASAGDGATYMAADMGGPVGGNYAEQALAEGIIQPKENVGAFRSQLVDSLSGKIIRIDPETGDGVPGNPFYDSNRPRSARSRVWSLGLRNPYRMTLRSGTGSTVRADANPGSIYLGDVGWDTWEELNVATRPGQNFGWPLFEGLTAYPDFFNSTVSNLDAPNPLYGQNGCGQQYFYFRDLLKQDTLETDPWFGNPCHAAQPIPGWIPRFIHRRAALEWKHPSGPARTGTYDANGNATITEVGAAGSPVSGPQFGGECSVGGVWYGGDDFPPEFKNTYFHADFDAGWIRNFLFDGNDRPTQVRDFLSNGGNIVALATHPTEGGLYYVTWGSQIRKISYLPGGNHPPTAVASVDRKYGPAPLLVQFTGSNSIDPDGFPLNYRWNFGDGSPASTAPNPSHTFQAPAGVPTKFTVTLTVTDHLGATSQAALVISANNTPPSVTITSPVDGAKYPMTGDTVYQLTANVADAEHAASQLAYQWQTILHHNDHEHTEAVDSRPSTSTVISPVGCDGNYYYYRVTLVVTDSAGLATTAEVRLYPNCAGQNVPGDTVWIEDALPAGSWTGAQGGDRWQWIGANPTPFSGSLAHQSTLGTGLRYHYLTGASAMLPVGVGDRLITYVYLESSAPPREIMLQWFDGSSWAHAAYWGANLIWWGTDGTASQLPMGALPPTDQWVRLEVPAHSVDLENRSISGMNFLLYDGRATWDYSGKSSAPSPPPTDTVPPTVAITSAWVDDALPAGAWGGTGGADLWRWVSNDPLPFSGSLAHQSVLGGGIRYHYFSGASVALNVAAGESLVTYIFLDPANPPREVMLQWFDGSSWAHAAYWGENLIAWGVNGTASQRPMGALPATGQWIKLKVPASLVGLEGRTVSGMNFILFDGRATWDHADKSGETTQPILLGR